MEKQTALYIIALALILALMCSGCMSKYEYQLRKADVQNQANHPSTYPVLSIKGPLNIPEGGELIIQVPNMPFQHAPIPDGQAYQLKALNTAAVVGGDVAGGYMIKRAAGSGGNTTINNNNGTATE